jgi:hypothetical protein
MRTRTAALLLVLATGAAGCGDAEERPVVSVGSGTTATTKTATTDAARSGGRAAQRAADAQKGRAPADAQRRRGRGCVERGITVPPFDEGACVEGGTRFVVANGRSLMRLRTLNVAIRGFAVTEALRQGGEVLTPQGAFLEIRLDVRNVTGEPQQFAAGQTLLTLEQRRFREHEAAERRFHPDALAAARGVPIPPGEVRSGVVVYDVPPGEIERITREGQLLVVNFITRAGQPREIGQFRIGAG